MTKPIITLAAIALSALAASLDAEAQTNTYTSSSAFFAAISSSNYTETFNSLSTNGVPIAGNVNLNTNSTNFSGGGFGFTAQSSGSTLYGLTNGGASDRWLTLNFPQFNLVFTNFSLNVSAVGGNFFATDDNGFYTNTPIGVTILLSDSSTWSTNYTPSGSADFLGVTFNNGLTVSALVISNRNSPEQFATANNFTVGVIPEPSTYALLVLSAAGLAGYVIRRRRL